MSYSTDPRLTSINSLIRELENQIGDHEWEGNFSYADDLRDRLEMLYKQRDAGIPYIPNF